MEMVIFISTLDNQDYNCVRYIMFRCVFHQRASMFFSCQLFTVFSPNIVSVCELLLFHKMIDEIDYIVWHPQQSLSLSLIKPSYQER